MPKPKHHTTTGKPLYDLGALDPGERVRVSTPGVAKSLCWRWNYRRETPFIYQWHRSPTGEIWVECVGDSDAAD